MSVGATARVRVRLINALRGWQAVRIGVRVRVSDKSHSKMWNMSTCWSNNKSERKSKNKRK